MRHLRIRTGYAKAGSRATAIVPPPTAPVVTFDEGNGLFDAAVPAPAGAILSMEIWVFNGGTYPTTAVFLAAVAASGGSAPSYSTNDQSAMQLDVRLVSSDGTQTNYTIAEFFDTAIMRYTTAVGTSAWSNYCHDGG